MVSREQQRCQPAYHSKSTPRECLGRLNFLNPLSCCCTARSFTSKRCQKTNPMGLLQCLATKHLSPNAFKWLSRAGKARGFGREHDPFLSFRTLPQVEALLAGVSADEESWETSSLLEIHSSMELCLQSPVLVTLAPLTSWGLHLLFRCRKVILCSTSASGHGPSAHRRCGGSRELGLESWTLKMSNPVTWGYR